MKKKNRKNNKAGIITVGGNFTLPGQKRPNVIVLTQPKRFGLDISDYMAAVRVAENVDFSRRYKLYDLYEDILMDTHLSCVLEKRKNAVLCSNMEFRVDGKPDDKINEQIQSPWFNRLVGDILDAKFWGFSLCQFYKLQEWVDYDLVPRKHVDPVRELILRHQTDITGHSWNEYTDLLFVGSPSDLGLLARLHLGSSTNVTLRATGHSSPRYSACLSRNISMIPTTTSHASGPWRMRPMPEVWRSSSMPRTRNSNSRKPETKQGLPISMNASASGATTKFPN